MSRFVIDRCRCSRQSFAELAALAAARGLDYENLRTASDAGRLCKHCRPWLRLALAGGPTRFELDSETLPHGEILRRHFQADDEA